jgi:hypothetical protein
LKALVEFGVGDVAFLRHFNALRSGLWHFNAPRSGLWLPTGEEKGLRSSQYAVSNAVSDRESNKKTKLTLRANSAAGSIVLVVWERGESAN